MGKVTCHETAGQRPWVELPAWLPDAAKNYLLHTEVGMSIRSLARQAGVHPSTVLRQVRRVEGLRDGDLMDAGLRRIARQFLQPAGQGGDARGETALDRQAPYAVLRHLCEPRAVMAWATGMDRAVVVQEDRDGGSMKTATVDAAVAETLILRGWIEVSGSGKISRYKITTAGRTALKDHLAGPRQVIAQRPDRALLPISETPLSALARRRDKDGALFLAPDLVRAGERLREEFELAGLHAERAPGFDELTSDLRRTRDLPPAQSAARSRVASALTDLGPGLGDVAIRCCCYLEGLEEAERHLGWSARSGKVVLRIALDRLRRHFDAAGDTDALRIG